MVSGQVTVQSVQSALVTLVGLDARGVYPLDAWSTRHSGSRGGGGPKALLVRPMQCSKQTRPGGGAHQLPRAVGGTHALMRGGQGDSATKSKPHSEGTHQKAGTVPARVRNRCSHSLASALQTLHPLAPSACARSGRTALPQT